MELYDYQETLAAKAITILNRWGLVYLAFEMRVGKTFTAFSVAERRLEYKKGRVVFITVKKAISSIEKDYDEMKPCFNLSVFNYEQIENHQQEILDADVVIIDEATSLGQFPKPAERTKKLKKICEGKRIIYLSGTPSPESYSQLFHQFWISSFSPWRDYKTFYAWAKDYVIFGKKYFGSIAVNDYSNTYQDKIVADTEHLFVTYTQQQAGFKQVVMERIHIVEMQESTYHLAKKLTKDRVFIGNDKTEVLADTNVKLMSKLHQIYSGTVICEPREEDNGSTHAKVFDITKARYIKENFAGRKIAIYYKFTAEYYALLGVFGSNRLTDNPLKFNKEKDLIFCSQIKSGSMGINLSTADDIIMYNIDHSAKDYFQVRQRMNVKDRDKEALLHWIFSDKGIERKIYSAVSNKKDYTLSYFRRDLDSFNIDELQYVTKPESSVTIHARTDAEAMMKKELWKMMDKYGFEELVMGSRTYLKSELK